MAFNDPVDYFSFASNSNGLILKSSQDGNANAITEVAECCVITARDVADAYKNPVCVYAITRATSVTFVLGAVYGDFMLHTVELRTAAGEPPTLTLIGCENEGYDAVQKHTVTVALSPRSKAHNPLGAITPGGNLVECVTTWTAEPVLVVQKGEIIASDIQHGHVDVAASVIATGSTAPSPASGWDVRAASAMTAADDSYRAYQIVATKTLPGTGGS